jgi:SAM-dependent methyltransferase
VAAKSPTPAGVDAPYDWSDYRSDFVPSPAYEAQEAALRDLLVNLRPESVLEVGPGFGRITQILTQLWPSEGTKFAIADLSEAAIEQTSAACPQIDFAYEVLPSPGGLASRRPFPRRTFDLVVAVEVLLHIPPSSVQQAVNHLAQAVSSSPGSGLITCDWTQPLPPRPDGSPTPIRQDNYCHDYPALFKAAHPALELLHSVPTANGLQTIFVTRRAPSRG